MRLRSTLVATAIAIAVAAPLALAGSSADPGVTSTTILLGGTSPLTGPAASYASVARGAKAYFDSVNAKGGVAKRKIEYDIVDDAYNPALTVQGVRRLVEQDEVFAVFNTLGTESNLAIREYLNQSKVPHLFAASGATTWGRDAAKYPWTIGFQPSYAAEGFVYGRYVAQNMKKAKIAVLFQNDDYGKDLLGALKSGLGRSGSRVVAAEPYQVTSPDVGSQIAKLKESGANVLAIFATPTFAIQAYVFANRLGWKPKVIVNGVSGTSNIMALASEGGKNKVVEGSLMAKYAKGANVNDVYHVYGMAVGYETVGLLRRLGANPTRAGLMKAARSLNDLRNPFLITGIAVKTGPGDNFPVQQGQLQRWTNGRWVPFGGIWQ